MEKVFNAIYKTDDVYAQGYIIFSDSYSEIEGLFALDYIFIYNDNKNTLLNLKSCFWDHGLKYNFDEFSSSPVQIAHNTSYFFFNNSNSGLYLEIKDEVLNVSEIQDVFQLLHLVRS